MDHIVAQSTRVRSAWNQQPIMKYKHPLRSSVLLALIGIPFGLYVRYVWMAKPSPNPHAPGLPPSHASSYTPLPQVPETTSIRQSHTWLKTRKLFPPPAFRDSDIDILCKSPNLDNPSWVREVRLGQQALASVIPFTATRDELAHFLGRTSTPSDRLFAAMVSGDPTFLENASAAIPDKVLLIGQLLLGDRFLSDSALLEKVRTQAPDSAWVALLSARKAISDNDYTAAFKYIQSTQEMQVDDLYALANTAKYSFLTTERQLNPDAATNSENSALGTLSTSRLFGSVVHDLSELGARQRAESTDSSTWLTTAANLLSLTETWQSTATRAFEQYEVASAQLATLHHLTPEQADRILRVPYVQMVDEARARQVESRAAVRDIQEYTTLATAEELKYFRQVAAQIGEVRAFKELALSVPAPR